MGEMIAIPTKVLQAIINDLAFLKQTIVPLVKGFKPSKWMTQDEVLEALNIGKSRLKQIRQSGQIRCQKPVHGRVTEYWRQDIEDYKQGNIIIPSNKKGSGRR